MKEVEILVKVLNKKDDVLEILKKFNFKINEKILDIYFHDPLRNNLSPDSSGRLKECFRLRQKGDKNYLAYKIDNFNKDKWIYSDEHEIKVSDLNTAKKIIENLGLKPLVEIKSEKFIFSNKDYEIILEDVKDLGLFLEVEKLIETENNIESIKEEILKFIQSLKIKTSEELNLGKPELILRKTQK